MWHTDADQIILDLALLENVGKGVRAIMRGIRNDAQANNVLVYAKHLTTLYDILFKVLDTECSSHNTTCNCFPPYQHLQTRDVSNEPEVRMENTDVPTDMEVVLSSVAVAVPSVPSG